jgi:hypothetical protein
VNQALVNLAVVCGALLTVFTFAALVARLPPVRWVWRHLFSDPIGDWGSRIIKKGAAEFHEEVIRPQIDSLGHKVDELIAQGETSWHKDKAWIVSRLTRVEDRQHRLVAGVVAILQNPDPQGDDVIAMILEALNGFVRSDAEPSTPAPPGESTLPAD